ncbi:transcriptional regulator, LuxR family [Rubellimicrobium mesophilum DSM 19309]|uniref:Transcriptional regulator, LuxR family n=1 Tax=Rubellimicrobium mesophilum DSM 19309 TaxID=442562 RepID=A0A017HQD5_9RHOB|nr:transcriptional regulator, LuxR family [Rubellimicrobium mesophilum DSM 19309]
MKSERSSVQVAGTFAESGLIAAIASWCECLQGRQPLLAALKHLAEGLDARAICLSRHSREAGGSVRSVIYNLPSSVRPSVEVTRSYADCVLGRYVDRPRPASVWFSSFTEGNDDPSLEVFQERARIAETVIVALALEEKWADYLEIHLPVAPGGGAQGLFNTLADTLSRTWIRRSPGLFSDAMLASRAQGHSPLREPILSTANPARLSRAEFRVCVLLSRGLSTSSVCSELSISPSTLKAHLRSIFAKTETSSMTELLYLLLAPWKGEDRLAGPAARRA